MTIDEMIAVLQAYKEGKPVQCNSVINGDNDSNGWMSNPSHLPDFDFRRFRYRVKPPEPPKPRERWVVNSPTGKFLTESHLSATEIAAKQQCHIFRVREVIE